MNLCLTSAELAMLRDAERLCERTTLADGLAYWQFRLLKQWHDCKSFNVSLYDHQIGGMRRGRYFLHPPYRWYLGVVETATVSWPSLPDQVVEAMVEGHRRRATELVAELLVTRANSIPSPCRAYRSSNPYDSASQNSPGMRKPRKRCKWSKRREGIRETPIDLEPLADVILKEMDTAMHVLGRRYLAPTESSVILGAKNGESVRAKARVYLRRDALIDYGGIGNEPPPISMGKRSNCVWRITPAGEQRLLQECIGGARNEEEIRNLLKTEFPKLFHVT